MNAIGEYWAQRAHGASDNRGHGKQLRRNGFGMAEERYGDFSFPIRIRDVIINRLRSCVQTNLGRGREDTGRGWLR